MLISFTTKELETPLLPNLGLSNVLFLTPCLSIICLGFFMRGRCCQWKVWSLWRGFQSMRLIAAKQVATQGKQPLCSVLVPSLGQLLLGKSGCACRSLAGTCLVGMANKQVSYLLKLWRDGEHAVAVCERYMHGVVTTKRGQDMVDSGRLWLSGCWKFFLNACYMSGLGEFWWVW